MQEKFERKIRKINNTFVVSIPHKIVKKYSLQEKQKYIFSIEIENKNINNETKQIENIQTIKNAP